MPPDLLALADWKRRVFDLYRAVRSADDPARAWEDWRAARDELLARHPQSPLPADARGSFSGLPYFGYDPALRALATVEPVEPATLEIATSGDGGAYRFTRFGRASFELDEQPLALELYWLEGYGGGIYLPFADATSGNASFGGGRYLLDTVKGDPRWVCPLSPPANRLPLEVRAGERTV